MIFEPIEKGKPRLVTTLKNMQYRKMFTKIFLGVALAGTYGLVCG